MRISLDHLEEIFRNKKIMINCYLVNDKIEIYIKNMKFKKNVKSYLINKLYLNDNDFSFISKQINVRKK